jgi:hypothetical protein
MNKQCKELEDFWNELNNKSEIKLKDIDTLKELLGKVFIRMKEIELSRNKWKERALKK